MIRIKPLRVFLVTAMLVIAVFISPMASFSAEIPSGMVIGDDQGVAVKKNGDYLINIPNVMPGKKWHTTISMMNLEGNGEYSLNMLFSKPTISGSLDLSQAIQMTLKYQGETIYTGPVSGINDHQNLQEHPVDLGVFQAGDSQALEVDLSISGSYTNKDFLTKNSLENVWTFTAVKTDSPFTEEVPGKLPNTGLTKKAPGKLPSTGEQIGQATLFFCIGLFLLLMGLLILKMKQTGRVKR